MSFEPGDVVTCPFPYRENPYQFKQRPALVLAVIGTKLKLAQITTTDRSGHFPGEWVHKTSKIGKKMCILEDCFINLGQTAIIEAKFARYIGMHPFFETIEELCKKHSISLVD